MRPTVLLAAALILGLAPAALARTSARHAVPPPPPPPEAAPPAPPVNVDAPALPADLPTAEEERAQADAMTAQLAALDARIESDETTLTRLRDTELAAENVRLRAIRPALKFHGRRYPPSWS